MTGTDDGHDSGGWKQHNFFSAWRSGTGGYEALGTPWDTSAVSRLPQQPSALQWKSADMSSMQAQGTEADRLTAVLELPQSQCTQVGGAVVMTWALPFCPTMYIHGFCQVPARCRWLWFLPHVPEDLGSQCTSSSKSSLAAGASHWGFPWTSPSLFLSQVYLFCLHTITLRSESVSQATYKRAEINLRVSVFGDRSTKIK